MVGYYLAINIHKYREICNIIGSKTILSYTIDVTLICDISSLRYSDKH